MVHINQIPLDSDILKKIKIYRLYYKMYSQICIRLDLQNTVSRKLRHLLQEFQCSLPNSVDETPNHLFEPELSAQPFEFDTIDPCFGRKSEGICFWNKIKFNRLIHV